MIISKLVQTISFNKNVNRSISVRSQSNSEQKSAIDQESHTRVQNGKDKRKIHAAKEWADKELYEAGGTRVQETIDRVVPKLVEAGMSRDEIKAFVNSSLEKHLKKRYSGLGGKFNWLKDKAVNGFKALGGLIKGAGKWVDNRLSELGGTLSSSGEKFKKILSVAGQGIGNGLRASGNLYHTAGSWIKDRLGEFKGTVRKVTNKVMDFQSQIRRTAVNFTTNQLGNLFETLGNKGLANTTRIFGHGVNTGMDFVQEQRKKMFGFVSDAIISIPQPAGDWLQGQGKLMTGIANGDPKKAAEGFLQRDIAAVDMATTVVSGGAGAVAKAGGKALLKQGGKAAIKEMGKTFGKSFAKDLTLKVAGKNIGKSVAKDAAKSAGVSLVKDPIKEVRQEGNEVLQSLKSSITLAHHGNLRPSLSTGFSSDQNSPRTPTEPVTVFNGIVPQSDVNSDITQYENEAASFYGVEFSGVEIDTQRGVSGNQVTSELSSFATEGEKIVSENLGGLSDAESFYLDSESLANNSKLHF